tara:strand:- start:15790 stop:16008 length:219 start_codon:yes stop_codon:yes gene_type:complete
MSSIADTKNVPPDQRRSSVGANNDSFVSIETAYAALQHFNYFPPREFAAISVEKKCFGDRISKIRILFSVFY